MLDHLYKRPFSLKRHLNGPLLESRLRYLKYCTERGASKKTLQSLAHQMLVIIDYLNLDKSENLINAAQIENAANQWCSRQPQHHNMKHSQGAKEMFISVATQWLYFLGRLYADKKPSPPYSSLIEDFINYMSSERGFSKATIHTRCRHVEEFFRRLSHQSNLLHEISITMIQETIAAKGNQDGCSRITIRGYANSLRAFFRYAEIKGWCKAGLAKAIMAPCVFKEESLPMGPSWENVKRLIDGIADDNPVHIRDRAILMLIAIYGLRSGEVRTLQIENIDWEKELIIVHRTKQGKTQPYPLSYTVGKAILRYLKEVRPVSPYREIFLTAIAPIKPLSPCGITSIVSRHLHSLNIPTNHYGPHSLRHACASHLLAEGLSLKEIGDYLGHRDTNTTRIYAKVDLVGLRAVADFDLGGLL
jgi:site-specific recombinase XerD